MKHQRKEMTKKKAAMRLLQPGQHQAPQRDPARQRRPGMVLMLLLVQRVACGPSE
jgi:hypothetical protein